MFDDLAYCLLDLQTMTNCSMNEMTIERSPGQSGKLVYRCLFFVLLFALNASTLAEIIPAGRRIQWDPGVRGGIPTRTTIFANVKNAPYNARGDGVGDDTAAIQSAINACPVGQVVYIPAGTYKISSQLNVKPQMTLRGAGMGITIIQGAPVFSGNNLLTMIISPGGLDYDFTRSPSINLINPVKGSASITTSVAHGWNGGDYILIDQSINLSGDPPIDNGGCNWCGRSSGTRPIGQWAKITAVPTATTATIDPPLYRSYDSSPQGVKASGPTQYAGVEDLTVDNSISDARDVTEWDFAVNCWFLRVEAKGCHRRGIWMYGGLWNTVEGCIIHDGVPKDPQPGPQYGTDHAYGIFLGPWPTACLVDNNIFHTLTVSVAFEGADSGNVFAYNLCTNMAWLDAGNARMTVLGHGAHSYMNLIEGNVLYGRFGVDSYWGTQSHFTLFRNRIFQSANKYEQTWTVDIDRRDLYQNIVGNVLGATGQENTYEMNDITFPNYTYDNGPVSIYRFGYDTIKTDLTNYDPRVKATVLRHGNWDSVTKSAVWDPTISDKTLPASLYLTSKPSWWGTLAWPPIGPDLTPMSGQLPAQVRFNGGVSSPLPLPPTNLRIAGP